MKGGQGKGRDGIRKETKKQGRIEYLWNRFVITDERGLYILIQATDYHIKKVEKQQAWVEK